MDAGQGADGIDEPVQASPVGSQAALPAARRGDGEWHQAKETGDADRDVGPLHEIIQHTMQREPRQQREVGREVGHGIGEREEATGAPVPHPTRALQEPRRRGYGERQHQHPYRPLAQQTGDGFARIRTEGDAGLVELAPEVMAEHPEGRGKGQEQRRLRPVHAADARRIHPPDAQKFLRKSIPA